MIMNYIKYYKNLLHDTPLGIDSDGDGFSDGWINGGASGSLTFVDSVVANNRFQKLEVTNSTGAGSRSVRKISIPCVQGDTLRLEIYSYVTGDLTATIRFRFVDGGGSQVGSESDLNFSNNSLEKKILEESDIPANTASVQVYLITRTAQAGDVGFSYFKDASLIKK